MGRGRLRPELAGREIFKEKTYRASRGWLQLAWGGGLLMAGAFGWGAVHFLREALENGRGIEWFLVVFCLLWAVVGAYIIVSTVRYRLTLGERGVMYHNGLWSRFLEADAIGGFRCIPDQGVLTIRLFDKKGSKKLTFPVMAPSDDFLVEWLSKYEDLDARDFRASLEEIEQDDSLGRTGSARREHLVSAHRAAVWLHRIGLPLTLAALVWSPPWLLLGIAILPWLVLWLRWVWGKAITLEGERNTARADLSPLFYCTGAMLAFRAMLDVQLVRVVEALPLATLVLIALVVPAWLLSERRRAWTSALQAMLLSGYGYGAVVLGNAHLDKAGPKEVTTIVQDKKTSSGRTTTYRVHVDPAETEGFDGEVRVPRWQYDSVEVGEMVCLRIHPGALRIRWVTLWGRCQNAGHR